MRSRVDDEPNRRRFGCEVRDDPRRGVAAAVVDDDELVSDLFPL
jgi:hypothetical protein